MIKQTREKKITSDAIQILDKITGDDPKMHALIEEERTNLQVATEIFNLRTRAKLSQEQLAEKVGTTQSVISRLEDADYDGHSLSMLQRIASALNKRVEVHFVSSKAPKRRGLQAA